MKQPLLLGITLVIILFGSCGKAQKPSQSKKASLAESDTISATDNTLQYFTDSIYKKIDLNFSEISQSEFQSYQQKYKTDCMLDSGTFIKGTDIYITRSCDEVCDTYFVEKKTGNKRLVPSTYDGGVQGILLSPTYDQLLVFSCYDGPDYGNYYEERAEFFIFNINRRIGLNGITPASSYYTKDWSIEDATWIDNKTIAFKIYEGQRGDVLSNGDFKYVKAIVE